MRPRDSYRIMPILAVLAALMAVFAVACASEEEATPTTPAEPTATRAPTPTTPVMTGQATDTPVPDAMTLDVDYATVDALLKNPAYDPAWGEPKYGGVVTYRTTWPQTSNCPWCNSTYRHLYVQPQYNVLVRQDPWEGFTGPVRPDLAESWEISDDGLTYTFNLREGVMFRGPIPQDDEHELSDMPGRSTEFTCEDAKASFDFWGTEEWEKERGSSSNAAIFNFVDSTACLDNYTFEVKLNRLSAVALPSFTVPPLTMHDKEWLEWLTTAHAGEVRRSNWYLNMGTGPFVGEDLQQDIVSKIRRNPNHWREGLPFVDGADFHVIRDATTAFSNWATGKIDILGQGSGSITSGQLVQAARDFPDKPIFEFYHPGGMGVLYNTTRPPFDEFKARKAVDLILDRQEWMTIQTAGPYVNAGLGGLWLAGDFWGHSQEEMAAWPGYRQPKDEDIAEANRLLDEVFGAGERPSNTCLTRSDQNYQNFCVYYASKVQEQLGMPTDLDVLEGVVERERALACQFDAHASWPATLIWLYDPSYKYQNWHIDRAGFPACRKGTDADVLRSIANLIDDVDAELDPTVRQELSREIEKQILFDATWGSTLEYTKLFYGSQPWMKGVLFPNYGTYAVHAWIHERYWKDQ